MSIDNETRLIDQVNKLEKKIDNVMTLLSGNGSVGVCERVRNNEKNIETIVIKLDSIKMIPETALNKIILLGRAISALGVITGIIYVIFKGR